MYPPARHPVSREQQQPSSVSKQRRLTAARLMRNQFRSSFRATARSHGQLRSLTNCCSVCLCVRGLRSERLSESEKAIWMTETYCNLQSCLCVCVSWHWTLVAQFFLSSLTRCLVFAVWVEIPHQPGQPFKFTVTESCDRIKEEFQFLQAQYHRWVFGWNHNIYAVWKHQLTAQIVTEYKLSFLCYSDFILETTKDYFLWFFCQLTRWSCLSHAVWPTFLGKCMMQL